MNKDGNMRSRSSSESTQMSTGVLLSPKSSGNQPCPHDFGEYLEDNSY